MVIALAQKDYWNSQPPVNDSQFVARYANPELAGLLPDLYPGVFPNLAAFNATGAPRSRPGGHPAHRYPVGHRPRLPELHRPDPGRHAPAQRDRSRRTLITRRTSGSSAGTPAGWPNGRRVFDDVATIELRAIAGLTLPLVDKSYKPDGAAGACSANLAGSPWGSTSGPTDLTAMGTENYLPNFPYLGTPYQGFEVPSGPA